MAISGWALMAGYANTLARPNKSAEAIPVMNWRYDPRGAHDPTNGRN